MLWGNGAGSVDEVREHPRGLLGPCSVSRAVLSESVATGHMWLLKFKLIKSK